MLLISLIELEVKWEEVHAGIKISDTAADTCSSFCEPQKNNMYEDEKMYGIVFEKSNKSSSVQVDTSQNCFQCTQFAKYIHRKSSKCV